ncbi:MamI family restriction endonuclease [Clostridium sp. YIM B02551]|uniref:MamI family restriction endonuclease n=1 Tax=Clostridium sp. YIM B02551 TaxID=2910679 RepID=UPI001EEA47B0|nr:MamI family restriction endonuclease [Clostridium sp. YIM B02551]
MTINDIQQNILSFYTTRKSQGQPINQLMRDITSSINWNLFNVEQKVSISSFILSILSIEDRKNLALELLTEQVIHQRYRLTHWSIVTGQSAQIDTGYVAQHLASLITQISGQAMRGKGVDLIDSSEIKAANFLDSLDKKGATAPRWNFTAVTKEIMERFLDYEKIYLLSMDLNTNGKFRTRMWKVDITKHTALRNRYIEWMNTLGYPKFNTATDQPGVNFQLFPPHNGTEENFARHGNGRSNGFDKLEIPLENTDGAELVFRADENENGVIVISKF